jgi:hypothetical protein
MASGLGGLWNRFVFPPIRVALAAATRGGGYPGAICDNTKRLSITGPCEVSWRDGMRALVETCYPGAIRAAG